MRKAMLTFCPTWVREQIVRQAQGVADKLDRDLLLFALGGEDKPCEWCGEAVPQGREVGYRCCSLSCADGLARQGRLALDYSPDKRYGRK